MKNKRVYSSPEVKGTFVVQSIKQRSGHHDEQKIKQELQEKKEREEEVRRKELEFAEKLTATQDASYAKGKLDAEKIFKYEIEKLKNEYASLVMLFQDATKQLADKREKIVKESESEIIRLVLSVSEKIVECEINDDGINLIEHVVKTALSHVGDKKIFSVRLSPDDMKKLNTLEAMKIVDQSIRIVEDGTISPGGCIVETDFGNIDSQIETRWEETRKALLGNKDEFAVH